MTESAVNHAKFKLAGRKASSSHVRGKGGMVRLVNSMGRNPLLHSQCYGMSSSTRCRTGQDTLMVDRAFQESVAVSGADGITWAEEENSYPQYVYIE